MSIRQRLLKISALFLFIFTPGIAEVINAGDVIAVKVVSKQAVVEALSGQYPVKENGTVDYPLYQDRSVINITLTELMERLSMEISKFVEDPLVVVVKDPHYIFNVKVLGQVNKPGFVRIPKGGSLQEVMALAGGHTEYANLKYVKLIRENKDDASVEIINFEEFLRTGNLSLLPEVKNNDTYILISAKTTKKVKVLGAVVKPGFYEPQIKSNLFDMIQIAGGTIENADLSRVRHITYSDGKPVENIIDLQRYLDEVGNTGDIPAVNEGDIILVRKNVFTWRAVISVVRDLTVVVSAALLFLTFNHK